MSAGTCAPARWPRWSGPFAYGIPAVTTARAGRSTRASTLLTSVAGPRAPPCSGGPFFRSVDDMSHFFVHHDECLKGNRSARSAYPRRLVPKRPPPTDDTILEADGV